MKKQIILGLIAASVTHGDTIVSVANATLPIEGYAIVDSSGKTITSTHANFWVGTFDPAFAANLKNLNTASEDQTVFDHFIPAGTPGHFLTNGFFNNSLSADLDGSLGEANTPLYVLVTYTPPEADLQVLVFNFKNEAFFPKQNDAEAGSIDLGVIEPSDIVFGNHIAVAVDPTTLPIPFQNNTSFENGITFDTNRDLLATNLVAIPLGDNNLNGIPNLIEAVLNNGDGQYLAPTLGVSSHETNTGIHEFATYTLTRSLQFAGTQVIVEQSSDLITWSEETVVITSSISNENGTVTEQYRSTIPDSELTQNYFRVKISQN